MARRIRVCKNDPGLNVPAEKSAVRRNMVQILWGIGGMIVVLGLAFDETALQRQA
ncbi:MAG TPA: hypothetical protein VFE21_12225 [Rubrobacteraceae bacterium]|nr:hypothetical protein [Rubrobacteraceae bacterium]